MLSWRSIRVNEDAKDVNLNFRLNVGNNVIHIGVIKGSTDQTVPGACATLASIYLSIYLYIVLRG